MLGREVSAFRGTLAPISHTAQLHPRRQQFSVTTVRNIISHIIQVIKLSCTMLMAQLLPYTYSSVSLSK